MCAKPPERCTPDSEAESKGVKAIYLVYIHSGFRSSKRITRTPELFAPFGVSLRVRNLV